METTLYYRQGSSDKVYHASITPKDDGHVVQFSYGRRGTTLQTGTKTQKPVSYEEARRIYEKLVAEKTAKGYTQGESGTPYQQSDKANQVSGVLPQLLNPISEAEAARLVADPDWCLQEKFDGKRMLVRKTVNGVEGINRKGLVVALPEPVAKAASSITGTFIIDGECIGDTLMVFDLLQRDRAGYRSLGYRLRLYALERLIPAGPALCTVETALDADDKSALLARLQAAGKEGGVFKKLSALYTPGRPASAGDALKWKFYESATFIVGAVNAKRSVLLTLLNGGKATAVGNVTIPPNHNVPAVGAVVEVRYLYAYQGGAVYQPVYLGLRDDIAAEECVRTQLKYKEAA